MEQLDTDFNIKIKLEHDTKLMLETTQERVKTKTAFKSRGWPKGSKNKVYTPNLELNRETW